VEVRISVSSEADPNKDYSHHNLFVPKTGNFSDLHRVILHRMWSPVVFKMNGQENNRLKINFESSQLIVLDIDTGWEISDAKTFLDDYGLSYIIGTTKSHGIEKITESGSVQPACDRFRVILPTDSICTDPKIFEYTMEKMTELIPTDLCVKNISQPFKPCKEIYAHNFDGVCMGWEEKPLAVIEAERKRKERQLQKLEKYRESGNIPFWIIEKIKRGVKAPLSRNRTCYSIGLELTKLGYSESEIVKAILTGPLKAIGVENVERAVRNGSQKA